jgi:uncharacterized repeat protein (TIGR02543 family)
MTTVSVRVLTIAGLANFLSSSSGSQWRPRFRATGLCALLLLVAMAVPAHSQSVTFAGLQTTVPASGLENPTYAAVDGAGDVFIVNHGSNNVVKVTPGGVQTTVPTNGLNNPNGIAVDQAGDVFVADVVNNRVVEVPYLGNGAYGAQTTVPAALSHPYGVALDAAGDVFISDTGNKRVVELPYMGSGNYGTQITLPFSGLGGPSGVALDAAGDVFAADGGATSILELPYLGGGNYGTQVSIGSGLGGRPIGGPEGVAVDANGDVFAADTNNNRVLEIPYLGNGNYGGQFTVGSGLNQPIGVAVDGKGDVFIVDNGNRRVEEVQTVAANFGQINIGSNQQLTLNYNISANDGPDVVVIFSTSVVTQGAAGLDFTLLSDGCTHTYLQSGTCSVEVQFAPGAPGLRQGALQFGVALGGSTNQSTITTLLRGVGEAPQLVFPGGPLLTVNNGWYPAGVATDAAGNIYMSGYPGGGLHGYVFVIPPGCNSSSCYKQWGSGWIGMGELAVDGAGNTYVPSSFGPVVTSIVPQGCTSSSCETTVGSGISSPAAVALDGAGDIYIADEYNGHPLYEVRVVGGQTTVGSGVDSSDAVAVDDLGDVFVTSFSQGTTLEVPSVGLQSNLAPWLGGGGALATDAAGDVYFSDGYSVTEVPAGCASSACDIALPGGYGSVGGLALDSAGNLYIPDENGPLYEVQRSQPPALSFPSTMVGVTSSALTVAIQNIGNQPLTFSNFAASTNFVVDSGSTTCSESSPLAVGATCNVGVDFAPTTTGPLAGTLTVTDDALNASAATQTISLSGTGSPILYALTTAASPSAGGTVTAGGSYAANTLVPLTATANPGYIFSGWTASAGSFSDANSATTSFTMPAQAASVTANFTLAVAPTITSASATTFSLGFPGTFTVTATGIPTPALSETGTLPSGVLFVDNGNGTATLSGTPTQGGTFGITITANNAVPPNFNQSFALTVNQASTSIAVTSVSPASEVYGQDAASTITALLSWFGSGPAPTASDVSITTNAPGGTLGATSCGTPVAANSVIATVPVGTRPVGIAYDPNNGNVYVANGTAASVSVVSGSTNTVVATIPVGVGPRAITFDPSNSDLYVANKGDGTVSVIDGSTNTVVATVPVGNEPQAITLDPNNGDLYVANLTDGTVSVINGSTNTVVATVPVGSTPIGIVFDPNNGDLYVTNDNSPGTVSVIGGSTNTVVATVSVANSPYSMAFDPNNGDVYVAGNTGPGFDQVSVINGSTNAVVATLTVPAGSSAVAFDANNGNVYVANFGYSAHPNGTVSVISGSTNTVVTTIPVGNGAIGISIDPSNGDLYVTNSGDGTVSVIDGSSNTVIATVPVGSGPDAIAFDPGNGNVYVGNNGGGSVSVISPSATMSCTATFTPDFNTTEGTYTMSASFSGDSNYAGSGSSQTGNFSITQASSSTSISSGQNPSLVDQSVTFTATIDGQYGLIVQRNGALASGGVTLKKRGLSSSKHGHPPTPVGLSGTVTWSANTGCGETSVSGDPGTSQCITSTLPQGTDTITATYSGDNNHSGSMGTLSGGQVVNPSPTPTSIVVTSVTPLSEAYGQDAPVTITAVLSWTGNGPAPTASAVTIGGNGPSGYSSTTCGAPSGDTLTCSASYTPTSADTVGSYTEAASFSGDSNYTGSSSAQTNNFSIAAAASSTSVTSNQNPSLYGQPVMFTATIDGQYGLVKELKSVSVRGKLTNKTRAHSEVASGGTLTWSPNTGCSPSSVPSLPATATCITSNLGGGTRTITATYSGDTEHSGSSGSLPEVVDPVGTTTAVTSSQNASTYGQAVSFSANVTSTAGIPSGVVQFQIDGKNFGPFVTLVGGSAASGSISTLTAGTHTVTARYAGSASYATSTGTLSNGQTVNQANTSTGLQSSLNPSNLGQKVTFTATVTVQAPGGGTVAGKVEFFDGATPLGTGTLSAGQAKFTTAALGLGPHAITAQYVGNADYVKSTSQPVPQSVQGQQLTVTPASLAFGSVAVGGHAKKVVTVTNPNPTAVSVGPVSLTVTQGDAWQFVLEHSCPSKLPAGQSCSIAVVFTPDAIGPDSATINIVNSAPGSPIKVPITAAGTQN